MPSVRVEWGERIGALYGRELLSGSPDMYVKLGELCLVGAPAVLVDVLGRALGECFAAYGNGMAHTDNVRQDMAVPPTVGDAEVGGTLSRLAPWATAEPLGLDGGASISDSLACGGTNRASVYLIHTEAREVTRDD